MVLGLQPSTFDPVGSSLAGANLAGQQYQNASLLQALQQQQRRQGVLEQFRAAGGLSDPRALSALAGDPELYTSGLQALTARQNWATQQGAIAARDVLHAGEEGTDQRTNAYQTALARGLQEGWLSPEQHAQLTRQPPTNLFLQDIIGRVRPPLNEKDAAEAALARARMAEIVARLQGQQDDIAMLTRGSRPGGAPGASLPPEMTATFGNILSAPTVAPAPAAPPAPLTAAPVTPNAVAAAGGGIDYTQPPPGRSSPLGIVGGMAPGQLTAPGGAEFLAGLNQPIPAPAAAPAPAAVPAPVPPAAPAAAPPNAPPAPQARRPVGQVFQSASEAEQGEILALIRQGKRDEAFKRLREIDEGQKVTGENAARVSMIQTGLGGMERARRVLTSPWGWGQFRDAAFAGRTLNIPALSGEIGLAYRDMGLMAEAVLRAMTGAAAPPHEIRQYAEAFMPSPLDSVESAKQKLDRLEEFAQRYLMLQHSGRIDNPTVEVARQRLQALAAGGRPDQVWQPEPTTQAPAAPGGYRVLGERPRP